MNHHPIKPTYQKQYRCLRTSLGIINRLMDRQSGRSLVASFKKNSFLKKSSFATSFADATEVKERFGG